MSERKDVNEQGYEIIGPRTPGAKRAEKGEYVFDFHAVNQIMGGPGYSPVFGGCVEGERMIVALMRAPAGKMGDPHLHPNEQWIYIMEGQFDFRTDGKQFTVGPGGLIYIPARQVHQAGATAEGDVVFFTVKDVAGSLHGLRADSEQGQAMAAAAAATA